MKLDGNCHGISCYDKKLIISFWNPSELKLVNFMCTVLKSFRNEISLSDPFLITAISSSFFDFDRNIYKVVRIKWYVEVIGSYGDMGRAL
jgi:hypothetical protein